MRRYLSIAVVSIVAFALGFIARDGAANRATLPAEAAMMSGPTIVHLGSAFQEGSLQQLVPGVWGKVLASNPQADAAAIEISSVKAHRHMGTSEFMYVVSGRATGVVAGRPVTVNTGDFAYIPKGVVHSFQSVGGRIKLLAFEVAPMAPGDMHYVTLNR
jgi:mannose-6-phosphate isomerase-like protein (cupin superfamily)